MVANSGHSLLDSGDSGSLMVEDAVTNPRAVGLLFAGSSTDAIANPIDQLLAFLGATVVGAERKISWRIAGSGDFNGDGQTDILWQNTITGERGIWLMNGSTIQSIVNLGTVP